MADGFVSLYQTDWSPARVDQRVSALADTGLNLEHPGTGKVASGVDLTPNGELRAASREDILQGMTLADRAEQHVHYWGCPSSLDAEVAKAWKSDPWDVLCRVRRVNEDVVVEEYYLDGFGGPRWEIGQDQVIRRIFHEFLRTGPSAIAMVADRWGDSLEIGFGEIPDDETALDDIVLGGSRSITIMPDLLILRKEVALLHPELENPRELGKFTAYDSGRILTREGFL